MAYLSSQFSGSLFCFLRVIWGNYKKKEIKGSGDRKSVFRPSFGVPRVRAGYENWRS